MASSYSPSAVDRAIKDIAHEAIRFAMHEARWYGTAEGGFQGNSWEPLLPPATGPTGTIRLKYNALTQTANSDAPPGARYVGEETDALGRLFHLYDFDPWEDLYQPWLDRIANAFEGWSSLPDPGDFTGPISNMQAAVVGLTPVPSGESDHDFASVDLAANLDLLDDWVGPGTAEGSTSALVFAFDNSYGAGRILPLLQNQAQVAILLGAALQGEKQIWEKTRVDIMKLLEESEAAFDVTGGGSGSIDLGVVAALVDIVGNFLPSAIQPVLSAGSSALSLVDSLLPPEDTKEATFDISGATAEDVYDSMVDAIRGLDHAVWRKESDLVTTLQGLLDTMRSGPASQFHIHPRNGVDPALLDPPAVDVRVEHLRRIGYETVPTIAASMGKAAEDAQSADKASIWERTGYIGYGTNGPYPRWSEVLAELDAVVTGSASELVEGGRLLAVGAGWLEDTDGSSREILDGVQDDLDRGKHGWDNSEVGLPPPVPNYPYSPGPMPV
ncbi:hypothetical protein [Nocardioides marmotae]|uniref:hypothetical protein n=1 Tax=Nocardioides marmotae TaxID=2663857 RepID=UPI0012B5AC94|nr:hypothetical protein [Nocardioides marmotae]MBC9733235.1 hypothetical protein [Nocardioides marmotae]MTB84346.1 hypothetical protein [Nocardioides marmotae]